ncbi:MAG TPA: thioredoxin domain-containing protein [Vicinamibacterales bacterium]|nr:thioredoxin domain-containing protein [Vicinamibacterales bacterium]
MRAAICTAAWLLLAMAVPALAQQPPAALTISGAMPDAATGTVTISGSGFGPRPLVTLDLVPLNLQLVLDQRIVAAVPVEMIPPGSYLLTVTRGSQPSDTASYDVRIGPASSPDAASASPAVPGAAAAAPSNRPATGQSPLPAGSDAAARVGDRTITIADVDREWQRIDPVGYLIASRRLFEARRRIVGDLVNAELLAREAASRRMTVEALLAEELPKRTVPLPDNAVTTLYQSLGDRARGVSLEQLRPALREWLARKVEPDLAKMTYIEELTKVSTRADILVQPPKVEVTHAGDEPAMGPAVAPVEVVMFGDFASPAYARVALAVPRVRDLFGARARFVFKHLPANDPASIAAAEAAACANLQGKFWPFHDTLLGSAGALDAARFKAVATQAGLDRARFDVCVDTAQTRDRIGLALDEARRYDLAAAPSLLVNGRLAPEAPAFLPPFEFLKRIVEEELARQAREAR